MKLDERQPVSKVALKRNRYEIRKQALRRMLFSRPASSAVGLKCQNSIGLEVKVGEAADTLSGDQARQQHGDSRKQADQNNRRCHQ